MPGESRRYSTTTPTSGSVPKMSRVQSLLKALQTLEIPTPPFQNLREFDLFPKLPTELCLRIWRLAAFAPRGISLRYLDPASSEPLPLTAATPAILHTCLELRGEGLKHY
jgi:hypothetical protein